MNLSEKTLTDDGIDPSISEEDAQDVKLVMDIFKRYKRHRAKYDRNWLHYYKLWRGDQWHNVKMPSFRQQELINMIWQTIQSNLPLQTDVRPKISFIPEDPADLPFANVLNKISDSDWERKNWLMALSEVILDGYLYGTGFSQNGYDPDDDYGLGSVTFESFDPFYIYPDPEAKEINGPDSWGLITAVPTCTKRLKQKYPHLAEKIKADIKDNIASSKTALNDFKLRASNSDRDMPDVSWLDGKEDAEERTLVITAYLKPQETKDYEEMDDSGEIKKITRKVYPYGRVVKIANGIKLESEDELPFANGKFPFSKYVNYILPREFYGVSEVEQLESPQRTFNKILNASLEIMNMMGNPIWVIDTASGVDPQHLVNRTGLIVEKEPGSEVRREPGIQLSGTSLSLIDRLVDWFNGLAGNQDVSRGEAPGSITAASAIEQLMEAARTRIRQKQRNLDMFIRDFGRQYAEITLEKYTKPRVFRVTNDEGATEYFRFSVEKDVDDMGNLTDKRIATIQRFIEGEIDGNDVMLPETPIKMALQSASFDVRVNTGSTLPFATADKEQRALNLFDRQIIDAKEVLDIMDFPNREEILVRMEQKQAELAQQQAVGG